MIPSTMEDSLAVVLRCNKYYLGMVKLVDTGDLKSSGIKSRSGSSPDTRTNIYQCFTTLLNMCKVVKYGRRKI